MIRRMNTGFGNSSELRIFIVDDNANHSTGIKQLLEIQSGYSVVGIATNGDEALKRLEHTECDVVLMDMNMPELDGVATIQQLISKNPRVKILTLTGYDDPDLIFRAMRSGAKGYILKTMITSQLINAIEEVMAGKVYLPPALATKFFDEFTIKVGATNKPDAAKQALLNYLTQREKEVLKLLTEGITYRGVADHLVISETTVKTHVNNIFQKLQVNDRTQAVLYAIKHGLVDATPIPLAV
ncbi:MAG: response regulator transcription factor [Vampirovibrionales bacterium]|nr:response regulator transcription factor [Vampirovibrionales bacterium]